MSWEAEAWARSQRTGDPVTKAVLVSIANWINARGDPGPVSIKRIACECEISDRTVQRHVIKLEGMGLLERIEQERDDGGRGWNAYRFPTYRPPKVSHVRPPDRLSPPGDSVTGGTVTQSCHRAGDTGVTGERDSRGSTPPSDADASDSPPGGAAVEDASGEVQKRTKRERVRGTRIPDDWAPPAVEDLSAVARSLAARWPAVAYAAQAEEFRNYWASVPGSRGRRVDWNRTWVSRIVEAHDRVMRAIKAGTWPAGAMTSASSVPAPLPPVPRDGECARSERIRAALRSKVGGSSFDHWLDPCAFVVTGSRTIEVTAPAPFARDWVRDHYTEAITMAGVAELGTGFEGIEWWAASEREYGSGVDGQAG